MQEEANQKTVGIAVQGTKMTGRAFLRACEKYLQYRKEQKRLKQQRREPDPASYEINQPKRVRVDRLLREGEGVSTPYVLFGYVGNLLSHAYRLSNAKDSIGKLMDTINSLSKIMANPFCRLRNSYFCIII